ncbi:MAG: glycosyltransferase family 4 protein [Chloroflexi bacterium]|nr:glycosyltransferase family 4 protein [Chloroflexota bacterium]
MRIAIDASRAATSQRTGTENYSLHLLRQILLLDQEQGAASGREFWLYFNRPPADGLLPRHERARWRVIPFPRLWTHLRLVLALAVDRPEVLFVPAHVLPLVHPRRSVVTIHDLGHRVFPEAYPPATLRYLSWATDHNIRRAAHLIADSAATRADILRMYPVDSGRVSVVYPGVDPIYRPVEDGAAREAVLRRYGIADEYLLYVGTLQPRKNVERLVAAYGRLRQAGHVQARLVLAGRTGWLPEGILRAVRAADAPITMTGYVPPEDMPALYSGALALVLPSLFEGFGLPALEAMACGTPTVVAQTSSLPEVVGDAGVLVDPLDLDDLARGICRVAASPALRRELRERGLERARTFTWRAAAEQVLDVLDRVGSMA